MTARPPLEIREGRLGFSRVNCCTVQADIYSERLDSLTFKITGGDWFRPEGCGDGGMSRTLAWPGKKREQILTANNDVAGRVGFEAAPVRMAA
jgi:hypothetical protein